MSQTAIPQKAAYHLLSTALGAYAFVVFVGCIASWIVVSYQPEAPPVAAEVLADIGQQASEPATTPMRRVLPNGGISRSRSHANVFVDWAPLVLLLLVYTIRNLLLRILEPDEASAT